MTTEDKKELARILDKHNIKSIFYSEKCTEGGVYHLIFKESTSDALEEDYIEGDIADHLTKKGE